MMVALVEVKVCWALLNSAHYPPEAKWNQILGGKAPEDCATTAANRLRNKLVPKLFLFNTQDFENRPSLSVCYTTILPSIDLLF